MLGLELQTQKEGAALEYFTEKGGKYISKSVGGPVARSPIPRIVLTLLPIVAIAGWYLSNQSGKESPPLPILAVIVVVFIGVNILSIALRKSGYGASIVVDQMNGRIQYKVPGGQRHSASISDIRELLLVQKGGYSGSGSAGRSFAGLFMVTRDGNKHGLMHGTELDRIRKFADELAILTSATVRQESAQ